MEQDHPWLDQSCTASTSAVQTVQPKDIRRVGKEVERAWSVEMVDSDERFWKSACLWLQPHISTSWIGVEMQLPRVRYPVPRRTLPHLREITTLWLIVT